MKKATVQEKLCKGCRLCVAACPKNAIMPLEKLNHKGYKIVAVDEEKCIGCGFCYMICPDYVFTIEEKS